MYSQYTQYIHNNNQTVLAVRQGKDWRKTRSKNTKLALQLFMTDRDTNTYIYKHKHTHVCVYTNIMLEIQNTKLAS